MLSYFFVGGTFDDNGGRESGYIRKLAEALSTISPNGFFINGGSFENLKHQMMYMDKYDVIIWMPDIPNDKPKLIKSIKKEHPHKILVTSKNNRESKYSFMEIIARALSVKSNLFVEFYGESTGIKARLCDPLGNEFCDTPYIHELAVRLMHRLSELKGYTRITSVCIDPTHDAPLTHKAKFIKYAAGYADTFHDLIHPSETSRYLGNASFRCESGFPSVKENGQIYVSPRNMDKRKISPEVFVPVQLVTSLSLNITVVYYKGPLKPSVDAPIQLILYNYYKNIKYMIHSHTYIQGARYIEKIIPCGAVEEAYEIIKTFPAPDTRLVMVNLRGHGSLVMSSKIEGIKDIPYKKREVPECV